MRQSPPPMFMALAVAACTTAAGDGSSRIRVQGQPIQAVIAKLGAPASEDKTASGTTYVWTAQHAVPWTPQRTTRIQYVNGVPNEVGTLTESGQPQIQTCTFRVFVDAAGIVTSATAEGTNAACHSFDEKLSATP